jgi:hypothetical protein
MQSSHPSIPLTLGQRARLIVECIPLPFFALALAFCLTFFDDIYGVPPPAALLLFLGFVILVVGWIAIQRLRDLALGVALLQEDLLERSSRSRGSAGPNRYTGKFKQLGRMRLSSKAYGQGQNGFRYRVYFSPASKIVWRLEPLR